MDGHGTASARERDAEEFAVRFHGRGGQGVVTAAELLSVAAFGDDRRRRAGVDHGSHPGPSGAIDMNPDEI